MDTTICGTVTMLSHWEIHWQTQSVCPQWRKPHISETPSPACEQTSVSDRTHHLHTRTSSEKCMGGAARYPWQRPLSHTDFNPTFSSRDTTELSSLPLGVFQGRLGTVPWSVLRKNHPGHPRGSRPLALFCWAHNQGRKWQHPKATIFPRNQTLGLMKEYQEALKVRWALDKRVRQSREFIGETLFAFRRSQGQARRLFNQKQHQSWTEYVSKLSTDIPSKHLWDRVRKISGKNICPPKQYLNGKNGTAITNPKDIANGQCGSIHRQLLLCPLQCYIPGHKGTKYIPLWIFLISGEQQQWPQSSNQTRTILIN